MVFGKYGIIITREDADRILKLLSLDDYEVTEIYEDSFRAIRKNNWILSEIDVELNEIPEEIDASNVFERGTLKYVTHVLRRYA